MKQNTKAVGDVNVLYDKSNISTIIRSTPPSWPNDIRGGNVHMSIHKKFFRFQWNLACR